MSEAKIHLFEHSGLGKHPFKLIGVYSLPSSGLASANPMAYQDQLKAMPKGVGIGSCAYCHTPLTHNFIIQSSDGKKNAVGCDCIKKVGDRGLIEAVKLAQREQRREKKQAERIALIKKKEQAERDTNGGKTDNELLTAEINKVTKKRANKIEAIKIMLEPFTEAVRKASSYSDFARSMYAHLRDGDLSLYPNTINIIIDITVKHQTDNARKNSDAFNDKKKALTPLLTKAVKAFEKLPDPRQVNMISVKELHAQKQAKKQAKADAAS